MTEVTYNAQPYMAKLLRDKYNTMYIGIARATAWTDDTKPPAEDPSVTALDGPILYKKVTSASLCKQVADGATPPSNAFTVGSKSYYLVGDSDIYSGGVNYLYVVATINSSDIPSGTITYRQHGLFVDLQPKSGVTKTALLPGEVSNVGTMIEIGNDLPNSISTTSGSQIGVLYKVERANETA
jgi:hypothetical protein